MGSILTKEMIEQTNENDVVEGYVYLRYLQKAVSAKNVPYLTGEIETKEKFSIIMWSKCPQYPSLENTKLVNCLVNINGVINIYGGKKSIHLNNITVVDPKVAGVNVDDLKCLRYNKDLYSKCLLNEVNQNLSKKGIDLFNNIFKPNDANGIWVRFTSEYAAKNYHDNCECGLLAHTYKCVRLLKYLLGPYKYLTNLQTTEIPNKEDIKDLLYLGVILHDIGKVFEMKEGFYVPDSFNSHRILGLNVIFDHKDEIIKNYNEHWYQALISIIVGHHNGEGESERARTLYAYIVHKIDDMEATFTGIGQILETSTLEGVEGARITWEDSILSL